MKKLAALLAILITIKTFHVLQENRLMYYSANHLTDTLPPSNPLMRPDNMYKDSAYTAKDSSRFVSDSSRTTPNYNNNILKQKDSTSNKL